MPVVARHQLIPIYSTSEDIKYACGCQTPTNFNRISIVMPSEPGKSELLYRISIVMPSEPGKSELNPLLYFSTIQN